MKKCLVWFVLAAMLTAMLTVGVSAASLHEDAGKTLDIAYGTPTVDGKLDDAYLKSAKVESYIYKTYNAYVDRMSDVKSSFYAYLLWDESNIYIYAEVSDNSLPADPTTATALNTNNDCIEFFFYLDDWNAAGDTKLYADITHPGSGQFRVHTPAICEDDDTLIAHLSSTGGFNIAVMADEVKNTVSRKMTDNGYIVEASVGIPAECKANAAAGKVIGFAIQVNDNIDGVNKRDALLWSKNITGDPKKTGPFLLLGKDEATAAPTTTEAPTTTAAPVTTAAPATEPPVTAAPDTTPKTADLAPVILLAMLTAAAAVVVAVRRVRS